MISYNWLLPSRRDSWANTSRFFKVSALTPDLVYRVFNLACVSTLFCLGYFADSYCLKPKDQEIPGTHCETVEISGWVNWRLLQKGLEWRLTAAILSLYIWQCLTCTDHLVLLIVKQLPWNNAKGESTVLEWVCICSSSKQDITYFSYYFVDINITKKRKKTNKQQRNTRGKICHKTNEIIENKEELLWIKLANMQYNLKKKIVNNIQK